MDVNNKNQVKKMRVTLLDKEGRLLSDKLLTQDPEIYKGPGATHDGPMKIEFTFLDKNDVSKVNKYLDMLVGKLPIPTKSTGKSANDSKVELDENKRESLIQTLLEKEDQDVAIKYLRGLGFVFMYERDLKTFKIDFTPKKAHSGRYQWMVRKIKESKISPLSDKFDPTILIGIKIDGERKEKVVVYLYNELYKKANIPIPDGTSETWDTSELLKYPKFMSYEERIKFSNEHRGLSTGSRKAPSKFYNRWLKYVMIPKSEKNQHESEAGNERDEFGEKAYVQD